MEQSPFESATNQYSNAIPEDCLTPGELAKTFGIYTETSDPASDINAGSAPDERLGDQPGDEHEPQGRPSATRVVRAMAILGIDGALGRTPNGRVVSYVTPQQANQIYNHFFPDSDAANQQPEIE